MKDELLVSCHPPSSMGRICINEESFAYHTMYIEAAAVSTYAHSRTLHMFHPLKEN